MKALLLENIHPDGVRLLTERGIVVESLPGALDEAELAAALPGAQLLGIRSKTTVTQAVLDQAPEGGSLDLDPFPFVHTSKGNGRPDRHRRVPRRAHGLTCAA